ncbi:MAG: FliO/MopB family protein [Rhodothermales bacterium]|nr:FliO/MopB family protein [Rhodothermales bacterium]MBO6780444.1 FliO/MopB family protein [Rhodothermales bacterium]
MRTNFPPTGDAPSPRDSLRRALFLSILLVIVWTAIAFLPDPTEQAASTLPVDTELVTESPSIDEAETPFAADPSLIGPGYMLVIVLLAAGGLWALWLRQKKRPGGPHGHLQDIGRFRLGTSQEVRLVRCSDEVLLLGVSSGQISLLKAYPASQFPGPEMTTAPPESPAEPSWTTSLSRAARAMVTPKPKQRAEPPLALPDDPDIEIPEWTVATASAISDGPDFMHVLKRYSGKKTYKANTLYPPTGASN